MGARIVVVDASVALKWFLPEADTDIALDLLRSERKLVGPWILRDEVVSGLTRRVRREEISEADARDSINEWLSELQRETVHLTEGESILRDAADLAMDLKHPLFDCLYLAVANQLEMPLVTADKKLFERGREFSSHIEWLADFDASIAA